jgi:hypothetical protein
MEVQLIYRASLSFFMILFEDFTMAKPSVFLSVKLAAVLLCFAGPVTVLAQGLENSTVALAVGSWTYHQKTYVRGQEITQARLAKTQCVPKAEAHLTIAQYIQKFTQNIGPDVTCELSAPRGSQGDIFVDATCSSAAATSQLTMNYKYSHTAVAILGEGQTHAGGVSMPLRIVASSTYNGPC